MWYRRPFWQTSAFPLGLALLIVSALSNLLPDRAWGQAVAPPLPPGALAPLTSPIPRVLPPEQPEIVPPAAPAGEPAAPPPEGPPVRVDQIRVEGVTVYDEASLRAQYADAVGPAVPRARLDAIVQSLQARYREEGYILTLVRGEFQKSGDQIVFVIRAIEGYVSGVKLDGEIGPAGTLVIEMLDHLRDRRPVNNADLERYLLLANDIPGVTVKAVLRREGAEPGAVQLIAQVSRRELSGFLNYDNRGAREAGPHEILLSGATNSFTRFGERLEAIFFNTFNEEQIFGQINADASLNSDGLRGRVYFGRGNNLPGGILAQTGFSGELLIGGGLLSYPVIRSRRLNLSIDTSLDTYHSTVTLAPFPGFESVSGSHLWISRLGLAGDIQDTLLADIPAANAFLLKLSQGIAGESTTRPENRVHFTKLTGEVTRLQDLLTIGRVRTALKVSVGGQYTGSILPPSEKFFLGGTRFGRGFFSGEVSGDRAIGSTIELQANTGFSELPFTAPEYRLPAQFYCFWDYGRGFNLAPGDISKTVQSVGLGVRSDLTSWLFGEIEGVHRLTIHPQGANVTEKGYAFFARVTLHY